MQRRPHPLPEPTRPVGRQQALARLQSSQKSNRGAAGYSRWVNRPLGRQIAALAYVAGLRPNAVTAVSGVFTFSAIAIVAVAPAHLLIGALVAALLLIGYAFDSADGQLARLTGSARPSGEWLDHVLDMIKLSTLHLALAIHLFLHAPFSDGYLLIPLSFAVIDVTFFFALVLTDMLRRLSGATKTSANDAAPVRRSLVVTPNDYGVLCLAFIALPATAAFLGIYAALAAVHAIYLLAGLVRWYRELSAVH